MTRMSDWHMSHSLEPQQGQQGTRQTMERDSGTRSVALVLWFTGLSGSGKSTIATRVHQELMRRGVEVEYIDGDALREVFPNTGFTRADREEHLRRTGYMASRLAAHGVAVVASFVSPYRESRDFIRNLCPNFGEVYVATPLDECERRDVKGLYARARRGELRNFTGIDDPYELPEHPELTLDTQALSVEQCVAKVLARFQDQL
jgi:adenylylsulfate kinase